LRKVLIKTIKIKQNEKLFIVVVPIFSMTGVLVKRASNLDSTAESFEIHERIKRLACKIRRNYRQLTIETDAIQYFKYVKGSKKI
jgi:hypothetical protein